MTFAVMATAMILGMPPSRVRSELSWKEIEQLLICYPGLKRLERGGSAGLVDGGDT